MKNIFLITFFIFSTNAVQSQEKYADIKKLLAAAALKPLSDSKQSSFMKTIITNFENAGKMPAAEFKKNNVGIAIVLNNENPQTNIFPAKFSFDDDRVSVNAVRQRNGGDLTDDMKQYVESYLYKFEELGASKFFSELIMSNPPLSGIFTENKDEYIITEPNSYSFVRGNKEWMYIISIDKNYKQKVEPRVIVYAFKISIDGKDIFNSGNGISDIEKRRLTSLEKSTLDSESFPLYHDVLTDDIKEYLAVLMQQEPFKSDKTLYKHVAMLSETINRFNLKDNVTAFTYFTSMDLSKYKTSKTSKYQKDDVFNIKHLAAHALGDNYLSQKKYADAIIFYKKAAQEFPYEVTSGTTFGKDVERLTFDISKAAYAAGDKDEAYGYLAGIIITGQYNSNAAEKLILTYFDEQKENKKFFKKDLDKAMLTFEEHPSYFVSFIFRGKKVFFLPFMQEGATAYRSKMQSKTFYKSL